MGTPLILMISHGRSGPPKSLFSLDSSGVRDVGVAGSNPVTPTIEFPTYSLPCFRISRRLVTTSQRFGHGFGHNFGVVL